MVVKALWTTLWRAMTPANSGESTVDDAVKSNDSHKVGQCGTKITDVCHKESNAIAEKHCGTESQDLKTSHATHQKDRWSMNAQECKTMNKNTVLKTLPDTRTNMHKHRINHVKKTTSRTE